MLKRMLNLGRQVGTPGEEPSDQPGKVQGTAPAGALPEQGRTSTLPGSPGRGRGRAFGGGGPLAAVHRLPEGRGHVAEVEGGPTLTS